MKLGWIPLSLIALFSFSIMVTLITAMSKRGVPLSLILFGVFCVGALAYGTQTLIATQFRLSITLPILALILISGALSYVGNLGQFGAATIAPNPGLALAIINLWAGGVAILAVIFLKNTMNLVQIIGLVVALLGAAIISLGSPR